MEESGDRSPQPCPSLEEQLLQLMLKGVLTDAAGGHVLPLYRDPNFTFHFAEDRIIPRFHLEGVPSGRRVSVYQVDPVSGQRLGLLATALVGDGGWVDLTTPIMVRAGDTFIAVPEEGEHS